MGKPEENLLEKPLSIIQSKLFDLDMVKGLEAYAVLVSAALKRYPEFYKPEACSPCEKECDESCEHYDAPQEAIDELHEHMREVVIYVRSVRQCMEQRAFGETPARVKGNGG